MQFTIGIRDAMWKTDIEEPAGIQTKKGMETFSQTQISDGGMNIFTAFGSK